MLDAKNPIRDPKGIIKEAVEAVQEFFYRKEFGLTAEEFAQEPWEIYQVNKHIMYTLSEIQRREMKKGSRRR